MTDWFQGCTTEEQRKKRRNELAFKYHPDRNPGEDTTRIMQEINTQYENKISFRFTQGNNTNHTYSHHRYSQDFYTAEMAEEAERLKEEIRTRQIIFFGLLIALVILIFSSGEKKEE